MIWECGWSLQYEVRDLILMLSPGMEDDKTARVEVCRANLCFVDNSGSILPFLRILE